MVTVCVCGQGACKRPLLGVCPTWKRVCRIPVHSCFWPTDAATRIHFERRPAVQFHPQLLFPPHPRSYAFLCVNSRFKINRWHSDRRDQAADLGASHPVLPGTGCPHASRRSLPRTRVFLCLFLLKTHSCPVQFGVVDWTLEDRRDIQGGKSW